MPDKENFNRVVEPVVYNGENVTSPQNKQTPIPGVCHTLDRDSRNYLCEQKCYVICSYESNSMKSNNPNSGIYEAETSRTLDLNGGNPSCNQCGVAVCEPNIYDMTHPCDTIRDCGQISPVLKARMGTGGNQVPITVERIIRWIVRRLTPMECERLQGFPDDWGHPDNKEDFTDEEYRFWLNVRNTHAAINGKPKKDYTKAQMLTWYNKLHTDSAEYKMWGNGIALPPALYIMQGMAQLMEAVAV